MQTLLVDRQSFPIYILDFKIVTMNTNERDYPSRITCMRDIYFNIGKRLMAFNGSSSLAHDEDNLIVQDIVTWHITDASHL